MQQCLQLTGRGHQADTAALACLDRRIEIGHMVGKLEDTLKGAANSSTPAAHTNLDRLIGAPVTQP